MIRLPRDTSRSRAEKCRLASAALMDFILYLKCSYLHYIRTDRLRAAMLTSGIAPQCWMKYHKYLFLLVFKGFVYSSPL